MSTTQDCQDCDPTSQIRSNDQAQPARKSEMSTTPVSSSLSGPPPKTASQIISNGHEAQHGTSEVEAEAILPPVRPKPAVTIEFCDRCRWAPRATWIQTELFLTFPTPAIQSITLIPLNAPETGGRFRVWIDQGQGDELLWDRKTEGGFPELKILKQRLRNLIMPDMSLGHSDKPVTSKPSESQ